jgi:hypothetical protein
VFTGTTGRAGARASDAERLITPYRDLVHAVVIEPRGVRNSPAAVIDTKLRAHRSFGATRGRAVLIRPDGHVACSTSLDRPEHLARSLRDQAVA